MTFQLKLPQNILLWLFRKAVAPKSLGKNSKDAKKVGQRALLSNFSKTNFSGKVLSCVKVENAKMH